MAGMVIIGAGECGVRAAFALREAGYEGKLTLIGNEPHLPYERPPLSKSFPVEMKPIAAEQAFAEIGIKLLRGVTVAQIDPEARNVLLGDDRTLAYDKLLIATGARARLFPGMEKALTLRTVDDAKALLGAITGQTHLAIVGGGFIGLELAATARGLGAKVTVVEAADRLMARAVPVEIAAVAAERHRAEGVDLILGEQVVKANENSVELADGRVIRCDLVVAGVGAVPNTGLAEAAGAGIANGIIVDHAFRTVVPNVFAAGDCCAFPYRGRNVRLESWRAAQDHANHVARAMLGDETAYAKSPWFWSDQYELTLQVVGLLETDKPFHRRELGDGGFILFQTDENGRLAAAAGIGTGNAVAKDIRLAEMMIERGSAPDPAKLADASVNLKALLKG
ncbi:MAG: FAD-dependent oxidoreductase [Hoeflea sp.]|uniref:NAD(P)/FAD-dependent oxidoreductase n=1 Tax=Hoeflea sp. TaxID=1940281 RepID=UPI001D521D1E|nr:FAD-dependent oxidoreductase [Hoeflea sp.]MBU4528080.1 FAD-dependent oxidoreductase [Alphaproteobacteria bacterium]MBU4543677.1 FAD-dependent oxidoreductase [Alphaproteobacteria bacterium]MBU4548543.1 FAD-dependent oxidoreductase [Alphaproteobacteria bacterium]MBV1725710.1 FAD-dependent oxidoreductase [Hoeflea sp.]MBV1762066.1 FAD-dependent oxidoreductase [Hoeflea sp.]